MTKRPADRGTEYRAAENLIAAARDLAAIDPGALYATLIAARYDNGIPTTIAAGGQGDGSSSVENAVIAAVDRGRPALAERATADMLARQLDGIAASASWVRSTMDRTHISTPVCRWCDQRIEPQDRPPARRGMHRRCANAEATYRSASA